MAQTVLDLLQTEGTYAKVCAPMVRYSKLNFRQLVRSYDVDLCFTPMIIADSFIKSSKARNNEFSTNSQDTPLIVQFASNNHEDFVNATQYVVPHADGVDLNCGCPQRWAIKDGYGCALLSKPEVMFSCVRQLRNNVQSNDFTVSVKVRLLSDIEKTISLCQQLEKCGVSFVTVHARTATQKHEPIDVQALRILKENLHVPIIANGDVRSLADADKLYEETLCNGVMSARGLLKNPALFSGAHVTPTSCIEDWICMKHNHFMTFLHHLVFMCDKLLTSQEKDHLNSLSTGLEILDFLEDKFNIQSSCRSYFVNLNKGSKCEEETEGKFFQEEMSAVKKQVIQEDHTEDFLDNCFDIYQ
uniref:tRNA-dihydrouridine(20a/20b) synthase [NAD(P)+] n=1 Tax=Cacopsylla melanoneura TaxID=428564 RepID=A0A8D8Z6F5_9HEMI